MSSVHKRSQWDSIPDDWEVVEFESIADVIDPQPDHRTPPEDPKGEPYVGISDFLSDGAINFQSCRKIISSAVDKQQASFSIDEGDIIFGKIGTIGLPRFLPVTQERYALSANVVLIKPKTEPHYVINLLTSDIVSRQILSQLHVTSQPAFGIKRIRVLRIPLPPLPEQQAIADILSTWDAAITLTAQLIAAVQQLKQGLMQQLLTGKVRFQEFEGEEWETLALKNCFQLTSGKTKPTGIVDERAIEASFPVYGGNGIIGYSPEVLGDTEKIIIGRVGEYCGVVYYVDNPCWITDNALYTKSFSDQHLIQYFGYLLSYLNLGRLRSVGGQPLISQQPIYGIKAALPKLNEQTKIADVLQTCDEEIDILTQKHAALQDQKKGLMQQLLTGQVRVQVE